MDQADSRIKTLKRGTFLLALSAFLGVLGMMLHAWSVPIGFAAVVAGVVGLVILIPAIRDASDCEIELINRSAEVEELQLEAERHRTAVDQMAENLDVLIFLTDEETTILYANEKAIEAFKNPSPKGHRLLSVTMSNELEHLVKEVVQSGDPHTDELTFNHPSERNGIAKAWKDSSVKNRYFVTIYDITDLRRLERVRRDFVANVSHEFRTPLTTIRTMTETMIDDPDDAEIRDRYQNRIINEVDHLTSLTNDLLVLSVAESQTSQKEPCNIAEICVNTVQMLQPKALEKGLKLSYSGPSEVILTANPTQMSQIVINLTDNALSCTTQGSVVVKLESDERGITLEVHDTGIGIAGEHIPRIFERFYRVDKGRSRERGGTGLGLSIVRHLVESHGGRISVTSSLGVGSTFTINFPKA